MRTEKRRDKAGKLKKIFWVSLSVAVVLLFLWYVAERIGFGERLPEGVVSVHYIDVGQGACALIRTPGGNVLIDTGEYDYIDKVSGYLRENGVKTIAALIATHPHGDHIGGMAAIIGDFNIDRVIMPRAESIGRAYERMLLAMKEYGLKAHVPVVGETFALGGAEFTVLAPNATDYENVNNYSVVLRMEYGRHGFLFTGDAEGLSEREMLRNEYELSADFLQIGHHGSKTSTTEAFLAAVGPKLAFIGVGKGNSFGHPHPSILERLDNYGVGVYRTDRHGDIVVETDGRQFRIITEKG